jgi:hypothetical protein
MYNEHYVKSRLLAKWSVVHRIFRPTASSGLAAHWQKLMNLADYLMVAARLPFPYGANILKN